MNHHSLIVLRGLVVAALGQARRVVEVAGGDGLPDVDGVEGVGDEVDLDALEQALQLVPDVPHALLRPVLNVVLVAPLRRVVRVRPLVVHVHEHEVVAGSKDESSPGNSGGSSLGGDGSGGSRDGSSLLLGKSTVSSMSIPCSSSCCWLSSTIKMSMASDGISAGGPPLPLMPDLVWKRAHSSPFPLRPNWNLLSRCLRQNGR